MDTYGYIIFWRGKKYEKTVPASTGIYGAKMAFCDEQRIPPNQRHKVDIHLAEKNGQPIVHTADY
jgi:hypothetical protein